MDPLEDADEMICLKKVEKLIQPTSLSDDIHELLDTSKFMCHMKEVKEILREHFVSDPEKISERKKKYNALYKNKNTKERIKKHHQSNYINVIVQSS